MSDVASHQHFISFHPQAEIYESDFKKQAALVIELQDLYTRVFQGLTPDFPEEDALEQALYFAIAQYKEVQSIAAVESQCMRYLQQAHAVSWQCIQQLEKAKSYSSADAWGLGGQFADYAERDALSAAQVSAQQVQSSVQMAVQLQPSVRAINPLSIAQG